MDPQTIKTLIATMAASDLTELSFSEAGGCLTLRRGGTLRPTAPDTPLPPRLLQAEGIAAPPAADPAAQHAPLAGIVHLQPAPGAAAFVQVGQAVSRGDTICLIEAMKVFNAVRAERDGTVTAILVTSGQEIDAGETLMRIA